MNFGNMNKTTTSSTGFLNFGAGGGQSQSTFGTTGGGDAGNLAKISTTQPQQTTSTMLAAPATATTSNPTASTTTSTGALALTTTTNTTDSSTVSDSINFSQLEEYINKWTLELEEQLKNFINQAATVNAWDKLLLSNNETIVMLSDAVKKIESDQKMFEEELEFIETQHSELEESIAPLQKELLNVQQVDVERAQIYGVALNLDTQLRQMSDDLKEIIDHINESSKHQDLNDPIVQVGKILNAQMSSLRWIESTSNQIESKLEELTKVYDNVKQDVDKLGL